MTTPRLTAMLQANKAFQAQIDVASLPKRAPETLAVITCMDPRINLEAIGISSFSTDGSGNSDVRIIRTIGGRADIRSLVIGTFLAGINEYVVLMHKDCGCCLAHSKLNVIRSNMEQRLSAEQRKRLNRFSDNELAEWLQTFADPYEAVKAEVENIKAFPFMPADVTVHGLVYDVETGAVEVAVAG